MINQELIHNHIDELLGADLLKRRKIKIDPERSMS